MSGRTVIVRIEKLMSWHIDQQSTGFGQMVFRGLKKLGFVLDVLQHIEHQQDIKMSAEFRISIMDVVAKEWTHAADVLLERNRIEIESGDGDSVTLLQFSLQQAVAAADVGNMPGLPEHGICQPSHHIETASHPEMIRCCNVEPPIAHPDSHGLGQVADGTILGTHSRRHALALPLKYTMFHKVVPIPTSG